SADFTIREFALRSAENADGWGLAWYPDQSLALIKEPVCWQDSHVTRFLETYPQLRSTTYVAHVRHKTTGGEPTHADTHPFAREHGGQEFCFAHNGTLKGEIWQFPLNRFRPIGRTDSEFAFCLLLERMSERGSVSLQNSEDWKWLEQELTRLNESGSLNVVFS